MCFADMDHKTLMRETEERLAGVSAPKLSVPWVSALRLWFGRRTKPAPARVLTE